RQAAASEGDQIVPTGTHSHWVNMPHPPTPLLLPYPCVWKISENLSPNVRIAGQPAALGGSGGDNAKAGNPHKWPPGTSFVHPPKNMDLATITAGSGHVRINGRGAARNGDTCDTCNEPNGASSGRVVVSGQSTVWIGD